MELTNVYRAAAFAQFIMLLSSLYPLYSATIRPLSRQLNTSKVRSKLDVIMYYQQNYNFKVGYPRISNRDARAGEWKKQIQTSLITMRPEGRTDQRRISKSNLFQPYNQLFQKKYLLSN
jgi:hypothetical protein